MRVLHIELGMNLYGGAKQVAFILRGLREQFAVENCLLAPEGSVIAQEMRAQGFEVQTIPAQGDLDFRLFWRIRRVIKQVQPDLVHVHSRRGAEVWGGLAARSLGVPAVISRRVDNPENAWVAQQKYGWYQKVITISDGIRQVLLAQGVPAEKVITVRSAVAEDATVACDRMAFRRRFALSQSDVVLGVVAQLIERKGHRFLLQTLPSLVRQYPNLRVIFFGQGAYRNVLEQEVEGLDLQNRVQFAGFCPDMPGLFGCLDLLVHPALMEGLGIALLQASQQGVPIIASAVGGIPEAVQDGENGLLVPPADCEALQQALARLLANAELRTQLGLCGKQRMRDHFSVAKMVEGNFQVYQEVLTKG
ncbi:MAG: glycosyltransferase [Thiotrichales bacterium]|nr:glycosyltransferase [Thiotrichales bacterium]